MTTPVFWRISAGRGIIGANCFELIAPVTIKNGATTFGKGGRLELKMKLVIRLGTLLVFALSSFVFERTLMADPVKISFLDNEKAITQTSEFLLSKGCSQEAVKSFRRVVDWYNETPSDLDLKQFPPQADGFYSFQSISNLVDALTQPLIYTHHQSELDCFDTVFLLAGNLIHTKLRPDDVSGPFLVPRTAANNDVVLRVAATPRDAFAIVCPSWWQKASKDIFRGSLQNKRICLTAVFDSFCFLPASVTRKKLADTLLNALRLNWQRQEIVFPTNLQVVIYHSVALEDHNSLASHAGLLFKSHDQYVYIEKAGSCGPYIRLDFENKRDLFIWYKAAIKRTTDKGHPLFATFNDREIVDLD